MLCAIIEVGEEIWLRHVSFDRREKKSTRKTNQSHSTIYPSAIVVDLECGYLERFVSSFL
jgi:hypothetical protein